MGVVPKATRAAIEAGLRLKRTIADLEGQVDARRKEVVDFKECRQFDLFLDVVSRGTVLALGTDAAPFGEDGGRLLASGEAKLPLDPVIVVPVADEGPRDLVVFFTVEDGRICFMRPFWYHPTWGSRDEFKPPLGVHHFAPGEGDAVSFTPIPGLKGQGADDAIAGMAKHSAIIGRHVLCHLVGACAAGAVRMERPTGSLSLDRWRPALRRQGVVSVDYRVCIIDPTIKPRNEPQGGTHASPRWHLRRGHFRKLPNGKITFVRQHEVGSKEHGVVIKDYAI